MVRQHERGVERFGKGGKRGGLRRCERRFADKVARRGAVVALRELDRAGGVPPGGVLQIEIDARDVRLPAVRIGDRGERCGDGRGALLRFALRQSARHEIDTVRIDERHERECGAEEDVLRRVAEHGLARGGRAEQRFKIFHQKRRCDPLVRVVRGAVEHAAQPVARRECPDRAGEGAAPDALGTKLRIPVRQSVHGAVHERAAPRDIRRHDGKRQRYGDPLPGPQRERVERRVCRFDRAERGVVPLGEREERIAGPHRVHGVPAKPWRERALGLRAEYAVRRQAVRALEGLQSTFCRPAENAVGRGSAVLCAAERQLQKRDLRAGGAGFQNLHDISSR